LGIEGDVQLRVTVTHEAPVTLIKVDGWLEGVGIAELARVLEASPKPVRLLLHDLRGADAQGMSFLRGLANLGTPLEGLSTYLKLVMAGGGARTPRPSGPVGRSETPVRSKNT
jgi:hypothetical protein